MIFVFNCFINNLVLVIFPIMFYFIYVVYSKTLDFKKNNLYLDCALISSYYLFTRFGHLELGIYFIFVDILLVISYIKKRYVTSFILSVLLISYYKYIFVFN